MRGVLVDFSAQSINQFYNLDPVPPEPFNRLYERPDYPEILKVLTNGRGELKLNSEGHAMHFKVKHLAYIPKVWHHFITSGLILTTNVFEVTAKHALLNYAIIQDIPFNVAKKEGRDVIQWSRHQLQGKEVAISFSCRDIRSKG